jgi:hypothetical protein
MGEWLLSQRDRLRRMQTDLVRFYKLAATTLTIMTARSEHDR